MGVKCGRCDEKRRYGQRLIRSGNGRGRKLSIASLANERDGGHFVEEKSVLGLSAEDR